MILEIPLADADMAYQILGGMPDASRERWFGIAPLSEPSKSQPVVDTLPAGTKLKKDWRDLPPQQQAGIRCNEPSFTAFLKEERPDDWYEAQDPAECVRMICSVQSRSQLSEGAHRVLWKQLDDQFQAWLAKEYA